MNKSDEDILKEQSEAARERNKKRHAAQKAQRAREQLHKEYDSGERQRGVCPHPNAPTEAKVPKPPKKKEKDSEQLMMAFRQLVTRLIDETKAHKIEDVDWFDKASMDRRKGQFNSIKDMIFIIRNLREVIDIVISEESKGSGAAAYNDEKVAILEEARQALRGIGIKRSGL